MATDGKLRAHFNAVDGALALPFAGITPAL